MQAERRRTGDAGRRGRRRARSSRCEHQIKVGDFFGAADFVPVTQAHIMADTESLGAGRRAVARDASPTRRRRHDRARAHPDHHRPARHRLRPCRRARPGRLDARPRAARDRRVRAARRLDDRHLHQLPDGAGADARRARRVRRHRRRDLFELGLRRALELRRRPVGARRPGSTGRTPRYGFHLDAHRRATLRFSRRLHADVAQRLGRARRRRSAGSPATTGRCRWSRASKARRGSDELKHFGAAMASFGSIALFHLVGVTPEAARLADVDGERLPVAHRVGAADVRALHGALSRSTTRSTSSSSRRRS